jgi:hypothetical protein
MYDLKNYRESTDTVGITTLRKGYQPDKYYCICKRNGQLGCLWNVRKQYKMETITV